MTTEILGRPPTTRYRVLAALAAIVAATGRPARTSAIAARAKIGARYARRALNDLVIERYVREADGAPGAAGKIEKTWTLVAPELTTTYDFRHEPEL